MDMRSGRVYESEAEALSSGVAPENLAHLDPVPGEDAFVVNNGPFRGRVYRRNHLGQMVRERPLERHRKGGRR